MPDYIYLLENRLKQDQRTALQQIRDAAQSLGYTVFLVGGAVRDLISGASVRDLDLAVQGNALKLKKPLLKVGAEFWGEHEASRTLFLHFPVGVRVEISSTRREEFPKPGKPVYTWDDIHADLRRRDFTANAMAFSLNEHSYGLLMDPLNGVADIEARQLRLVNNYGFLEDPIRLVRAVRLSARTGWEIEERTRARYENAKEENAIAAISSYQVGYELEEIAHEEDGLRILSALENEGWMQHLFPAWTSAKADARMIEEMYRLRAQLEPQGVSPDSSAISMRLLTARLSQKELAALQKALVRPGFVEEWSNLDTITKEFAKQITSKAAATPSTAWKIFTTADPQAVLWLGLSSKSAAVQAQYRNFTTVWPEAKQKIPSTLMLEMRIKPGIPGYDAMLQEMFLAAIDGKLETEEQMKAFLEPYSPPAPPPPVSVRRSRSSRKSESKAASRAQSRSASEAAPAEGAPAEAKEALPEPVATEGGQPKAKGQKKAAHTGDSRQPANGRSAEGKSDGEVSGAKAKSAGPKKAQSTAAAGSKQAEPARKTEKQVAAKKAGAPAAAAKSAARPAPSKVDEAAEGKRAHSAKAAKSTPRPAAPSRPASHDKHAVSHAGAESHKPAAHAASAQKKHSTVKAAGSKKQK